jgi:hypothetical protein
MADTSLNFTWDSWFTASVSSKRAKFPTVDLRANLNHLRVMALLFAPFRKFMPSLTAAVSRVMSCTVRL